MKIIVDDVTQESCGIWTAHIDPRRLMKLFNPIRQGGYLSIVLIEYPLYIPDSKSLQFGLDSAVLLNIGNTFEVILIDNKRNALVNPQEIKEPLIRIQSNGDVNFIDKLQCLPKSIQKLGELLLTEVRKAYPGELIYHDKSKKFVESPDNFWVVRIQPRVQSLRIVVYGTSREHGPKNYITLKDDMAGYACFILENESQLSEAINVILQAKRFKDAR